MRLSSTRLILGCLAAMALSSPPLLAQKYEIHPYGGGFWPTSSAAGTLKNEGIYGVKGGFFIDNNIELEGNFGYINHFEIEDIDSESRGLLWEMAANFHLSEEFGVPRQMTPYFAVGVGGITTKLDDTVTLPQFEMESGDTFFSVSYGGGFKSIRLWGPVGVRADVRGRTMPNYYGGAPSWLEATAGINLMWGER